MTRARNWVAEGAVWCEPVSRADSLIYSENAGKSQRGALRRPLVLRLLTRLHPLRRLPRDSVRQTLDAGYGAGFWLNVTDAPMEVWPVRWGMPGVPKDAYFARGYLGQYIVVVPSARLVVVRMGVSRTRGGGIQGAGELVHAAIEAIQGS